MGGRDDSESTSHNLRASGIIRLDEAKTYRDTWQFLMWGELQWVLQGPNFHFVQMSLRQTHTIAELTLS